VFCLASFLHTYVILCTLPFASVVAISSHIPTWTLWPVRLARRFLTLTHCLVQRIHWYPTSWPEQWQRFPLVQSRHVLYSSFRYDVYYRVCLLYTIQSFNLLSYAVCLILTGLRSYNISWGHLISPLSATSSNIFGDRIQLATLLSSFVFFGIYCGHGRRGSSIYTLLFAFLEYYWRLDHYKRRYGLDAAGHAKHIIQMNPITYTNSSTLLVFSF
jgi:hypothetical protein